MGVLGLQTYVLQCPQASYRVDIKQLILAYQQAKGVKEVTIVMSGNCILGRLYGDLNWICGGQFKQFKAKVENFVNSFEPLGVRLVVFFEGMTTKRKRPIWVQRRYEIVESIIDIYSKLRRDQLVTGTENNGTFFVPTSLTMIQQYLFEFVCECKVRIAVGGRDQEIADFARSENCFAFLGLGTELIIQNCFHHFFSLFDLDLSTMTGIKYDSWGLARALQIPAVQLPLFATLCGNIPASEEMQTFHKTILREYGRRTPKTTFRIAVMHAIAAYIRTLPMGQAVFDVLPQIALKMFGDADRALELELSIRSYLPKTPSKEAATRALEPASQPQWEEILMKAQNVFCGGGKNSMYAILTGQPFEMTNALEDYRKDCDLPVTPTLYLPLRQRIYGILLEEKPDGAGLVEEWCCRGMNSLNKPAFVEPVSPPEALHPGLLALWGHDQDMVDARWKLFALSVSPELSFEPLRDLTDQGLTHLVVPTLILRYIREAIPREASASCPQYLYDWEVEALIIQAVLLTTTDPSRLTVESPYEVRAIQLATLFMRGVSHMLLLLASCGFPVAMAQAMPWLFFDGKLFHQTYVGLRNKKHVESLCINQEGKSLMEEFLKVRNIVLGQD